MIQEKLGNQKWENKKIYKELSEKIKRQGQWQSEGGGAYNIGGLV